MKILIVSGSMPPMKCGVGDYSSLLAENLAKFETNEVLVITTFEAKEINAHNLQVLPLISEWNIKTLLMLRSKVKEWNPDIVHIQYPTSGYGRSIVPSFLPLFMKLNTPVVQTWHEYLSKKGCIRYLPNLMMGDLYIVVRDNYLEKLPYFYRKILKSKIQKIPVASAIPKYIPSGDERKEIRAQYINSDEIKLITFFGFVSKHKCIDKIIDLIDSRRHILLLIGNINESDPYHRNILAKITELGLEKSVFITGYMEPLDVARILSVSDVSVFPFCDGVDDCNTSFLAAKKQGNLVIATHKSKEGFYSSENVWYVQPGAYEKIKEILNNIPLVEPIQNDEFSWAEISDSHQKLYLKLLSGKHHT